jgi:hypothetical protein
MLGATTLPTVRYTKMDMAFNDAGNLSVAMSGESDEYRNLAERQILLRNLTGAGDIDRVSYGVGRMVGPMMQTLAKQLDPDVKQDEQPFE